MDKLKMHSPGFVEENVAKIAALFPNCVTESTDEDGNQKKSIDFDLLRQELSTHIVEGPQERYQLNWPGKREALLTANAPIAKTLRPCREESVDFYTTENLFIEGDNLDALKLLQETYLGKVKMIYIDPPYNTGKDFIYADNFSESTEEYLLDSGQKDEGGNRLIANTESNGRFHSDWLSMMYSRLKLARNLLKDDGVIFISIDDNEAPNLQKICNEIYGEKNFIFNFPRITKKAGKSSDYVAKNNDSILLYRKSSNAALNSYSHTDEGFKYVDEYESVRGKYKLNQTLDYGSIQYSTSLDYEIEIGGITLRPGNVTKEEMLDRQNRNPKSDFCWRWTEELYLFGLKSGFIVLKESRNGPRIYTKTYENATIEKINGEYRVIERNRTKSLSSLEFIENKYSNDNSRKDIGKIFDKRVFEYSKPVSLIKECSFLSTESGDIILDFFAGSATTAHAVMQLNAEDGGNRRFIMIQLPESCEENSEAFKAGYKTIAEIGKERIRRAGKKIKEENAITAQNLDIGFRVFKIDSSNMADIYYTPDETIQTKLFENTDNIKDDRTEEDLLFQVLLDWGVDLTLPITKETITDLDVFFVDGNALVACFVKNGEITEDFCKELAKREPLRVVFRDSGFANDGAKINVEQIFKLMSPHTDVKTI